MSLARSGMIPPILRCALLAGLIACGEADESSAPEPATVQMSPEPVSTSPAPPAQVPSDETEMPGGATATPITGASPAKAGSISYKIDDAIAPSVPPSPLKQLQDSLSDRLVRFNVPDGRVEETVSALLVIDPSTDEAAAAALFELYATQAHAPVTGDRQTAHVRVSPRTRAILTSRSPPGKLGIEAITPELRLIDPDIATRWEWRLTPHEGGAHTLLLTLYAVAEGGGDLEIETWSREMQVEVDEVLSLVELAQAHWEWVWTFLLGPLGALGWRRYKRREAQSAPSLKGLLAVGDPLQTQPADFLRGGVLDEPGQAIEDE